MQDLDYYKKKLLWEKQSMLHQIGEVDDKGYEGLGHSLRYSTGELSFYDNHPADQGTNTFDRAKDIGIRGNAQLILQMIDDALEKIETGQYGHCDSCGKAINPERLEAMPYSTFCFDCKSKSELRIGTNGHNSRPIEENAIDSLHNGNPFAMTDDTDNVAFDGEDAWQAVARYGTSNTPSDITGAIDDDDSYIDADENQGLVNWGDQIMDKSLGDGEVIDKDDQLTGQRQKRRRKEWE
ncbi:TraR/DksA family transcriptional regulator [Orenia metallireducens]|uniref:Transcriptional regulator, TraR/DksA family n=1 Tax=Orenia metallireducens TaxID=1413210 RepID=A0A285FF08_9FIRM|nr:TraR/DksA C4-type zinc finger protein [Orenia metallireducens]PRX33512.1 TraR/DksA family transcriptional regulator [Orenia metallireducens]SNY09889.1 transcriptional regulator, TraR/DksA family [Orenia metallireducens]